MQRLSGLDASFLYLETPSSYMHVAGLMILDPSTAPVEWSFDQVRDMYGAAAAPRAAVPAPARRGAVRPAPPGVDRGPRLRPRLPHPSHRRASTGRRSSSSRRWPAEIVGRSRSTAAGRCGRSWIIEGLEDGYIAVLTKVHHAAIDGASGNEMTVAMLDTEPAGRDVGSDAWQPEHVPNDAELLAYAVRSLSRQPAKLVGSLNRTGSALLNVGRQTRQADIAPPPAPFTAPRTSWNYAVVPAPLVRDDDAVARRREGGQERVRHHAQRRRDGDVCDCSALLHRHARREARPGPRRDGADVGAHRRPERCRRQPHLLDARVARHDDRRSGRALARDLGRHAPGEGSAERDRCDDAAGLGRVRRTGGVRASRARSTRGTASPIDTGRSSTSRSRTFPVRRFPSTPQAPGWWPTTRWARSTTVPGSNITVLSYMNQLDFGIVTCRELLPDAWAIADGLREALHELKKGAEPRRQRLRHRRLRRRRLWRRRLRHRRPGSRRRWSSCTARGTGRGAGREWSTRSKPKASTCTPSTCPSPATTTT